MSSAVRISLLAACAILSMPLVAAGQKEEVRVLVDRALLPAGGSGAIVLESFDSPPPRISGTRIYRPSGLTPLGGSRPAYGPSYPSAYQPSRSVQPQEPRWVIPTGEYGLELTNGMRMTGRPAKDWTARITTAFGTVTVPLPQISHIAPAANGQFSAYLKNGDRVTGTLGSNTMKFETKFGTLNVSATEIARLRSSSAGAPQPVAASPAGAGPSRNPSRVGTPVRGGTFGPSESPGAPPSTFSRRRILRK